MTRNPKIKNREHILSLAHKIKEEGKKIVLVYGHFNVIHPGHIRFLNFAKSLGDQLIVAIVGQKDLKVTNEDDYYTQDDRALGVSSHEMVDGVHVLESSIVEFIKDLKPNFYVKGREFESKKNQIQDEISAIEHIGGKIIFSSGEVDRSNFKIQKFQNSFEAIHKRKFDFYKTCEKQEISLTKIQNHLSDFHQLKILVIGDTIVDQFVSCDTLGVSSEAPVLAIRELENREFIGGAAIIAQHIKSLGADCTFVSVLGEDHTASYVRKNLDDSMIKSFLLSDPSRPTTFKIRYMVENQKLLRVSRLKQHDISSDLEEKILTYLDQIQGFHGIIISDFVYGVITEKILHKIFEISRSKNIKVFGDVQCSSQLGDVTKFKNIELITPTEKEARIGLSDQSSGLEALAQNLIRTTNNRHVAITLGSQGILAYSHKEHTGEVISEYFSALEENPVDVAGAGDSVMSGYALGLCSGLSLMEASAFASCLAGISVSRIGNIPIKTDEIQNYIQEIINISSRQSKDND